MGSRARRSGWGALRPCLHEAVAYEPRPDLDEPVVAAVERAGYRLGPRLIRAARVSVAGPTRSS